MKPNIAQMQRVFSEFEVQPQPERSGVIPYVWWCGIRGWFSESYRVSVIEGLLHSFADASLCREAAGLSRV